MARKQQNSPRNRGNSGDPALPPLPPAVPDGTRVYAIGDIHGRMDLLGRLLRRIGTDALRARAERKVLVCLGDYVDRGPASRAVLDCLAGTPMPGFETHFLLGNHEDIMLTFLTDPGFGANWVANGGDATLESYAVEVPDPRLGCFGANDFRRAARELRAALPKTHLAFLRGLERSHIEGDYLFVHAGIRPGVALVKQNPDDLIWIRRDFVADTRAHEKLVVHGHTIVDEPEVRPNRIGIDTGAWRSGHLTALVLEGDHVDFIAT